MSLLRSQILLRWSLDKLRCQSINSDILLLSLGPSVILPAHAIFVHAHPMIGHLFVSAKSREPNLTKAVRISFKSPLKFRFGRR